MSSQHPHRRRGAIAPIPTVCGEDKPPAPAAAGGGGIPAAEEYPCVRRTRHRRLLTFLWLQGFEAAFGSVAGETGAFFSVPRLRQLVERGQWADAIRYLLRFLPRNDSPSAEARALHLFLETLNHLANVVAGNKDGDALASHYSTWLRHENTMSSGAVRLQCILLNIFHAKQQLRVYWNWERVRRKASEIVDDLAYRTPELKDLVLMPGGPMKAHDVLPIGFGLHRRYCFKKQVRRPRASALAKHFLLKRSSQASSNHFQGSHDELLNKTLNWTADAIDDCLKAGKLPALSQQQPLQQSGNQGATCNAALQNTSATLTNHAINSMVSTVRGAGAPVSPLYQTMFGNMAGPVRNPGVPFVPNPGNFANPVLRTPAAPVSQTILASHVRTPGAPLLGRAPVLQTTFARHVPSSGTPVSQTMLASYVPTPGAPLSGLAPVSQTMLASNVPLPTPGAPSSGTMFHAPVSQTVFGCLTNPDKSSGISLMTNAGTNKHPSQENEESSQQALNPENHPPRTELRSNTTGALGETIMTSVIKTEAGDLTH